MLPDKNDLEIYIHIPFCISKCRYCDFVSAPGTDEEMDRYVKALCNEIRAVKGVYDNRHITSIYFGGGTPSILSIDNFTKIVNAVEETFPLKRRYAGGIGPFSLDGTQKSKLAYYMGNGPKALEEQVEFTIECNPDTVNPEKFKAYKKIGVNRISFGLQSNSNKELKLLGRTYTVDDFTDAYFAARDAGFENINIDLIQSIPGQKTVDFMKSLYSIMMLGPDHISAYSLIVEDGTPFGNMTITDSSGNMILKDEDGKEIPYPTEEEDREIYHTASGFLDRAGLERYEISNFAKPYRECRHNLGYWRRQNYIGFGVSAASMVDNVRWKNINDKNSYEKFCLGENIKKDTLQELPGIGDIKTDIEKLSVRDQMAEFMFLGLRLGTGIAKEEFMEAFGVDFDFQYGDITRKFIDEGLIEVKELEFYDPVKKTDYVKTRVYLTDRGIDVSNSVMSEYMP